MPDKTEIIYELSDPADVAWLKEQAAALAIDDEGLATRMLIRWARRNGVTLAVIAVPAESAAPPMTITPYRVPEQTPVAAEPEGPSPEQIDAIVASAYQEAEDRGLVVPLHADEAVPNPSDQARPKVRALRRPPVPFSRGTQPAFLEQ